MNQQFSQIHNTSRVRPNSSRRHICDD